MINYKFNENFMVVSLKLMLTSKTASVQSMDHENHEE